MKTCERFHFDDVEVGDILHFTNDGVQWWDGPDTFTIVVADKWSSDSFGDTIESVDPVYAYVDHTFYVIDDWVIKNLGG